MITCKNNFSETVKIATGNYARTIRAAVAWFCMVKELLEKFHKRCWKGPTMKFFLSNTREQVLHYQKRHLG